MPGLYLCLLFMPSYDETLFYDSMMPSRRREPPVFRLRPRALMRRGALSRLPPDDDMPL